MDDRNRQRYRSLDSSEDRTTGRVPRGRLDRLIVGRLKAHGNATYQFRQGEAPSYFVKVMTDRGERILWGKDLERAIASSSTQPQIGDLIGARRIAREAVTITDKLRDTNGRVVRQTEQLAHRNRWRVEKVQFFTERAKMARRARDAQLDAQEAVRAHPELKSTFLSMRAAEEFATRRIPNEEDRKRFVELVKEAVAGSIRNGAPLPEVRLRNRTEEREVNSVKSRHKEPPHR